MTATPRRRRQLAIWWHVLTSVGWMSMSVVLLTMMLLARSSPAEAVSAMTVARRIDVVLLAPLANASAATGIVLGLGTPWGLAVHRWVLAKLVITVLQLQVGVFLMKPGLDQAVTAARSGWHGPSWTLVAGTVLMAGAIATQAWLSIAKPGRPVRRRSRSRDRAGRPTRPATAPSWVLLAAVIGPMIDIGTGLVVGFPAPILSVMVVVAAAVERFRVARSAADTTRTLSRPDRSPAAP